jgi:hypothetical protein
VHPRNERENGTCNVLLLVIKHRVACVPICMHLEVGEVPSQQRRGSLSRHQSGADGEPSRAHSRVNQHVLRAVQQERGEAAPGLVQEAGAVLRAPEHETCDARRQVHGAADLAYGVSPVLHARCTPRTHCVSVAKSTSAPWTEKLWAKSMRAARAAAELFATCEDVSVEPRQTA